MTNSIKMTEKELDRAIDIVTGAMDEFNMDLPYENRDEEELDFYATLESIRTKLLNAKSGMKSGETVEVMRE